MCSYIAWIICEGSGRVCGEIAEAEFIRAEAFAPLVWFLFGELLKALAELYRIAKVALCFVCHSLNKHKHIHALGRMEQSNILTNGPSVSEVLLLEIWVKVRSTVARYALLYEVHILFHLRVSDLILSLIYLFCSS